MKEMGVWFGVLFFFFAAISTVFLCGGAVGFGIGYKWRSKTAETAAHEAPLQIYLCKSETTCYHLQPDCRGVSLKPLQPCKHCSKKLS